MLKLDNAVHQDLCHVVQHKYCSKFDHAHILSLCGSCRFQGKARERKSAREKSKQFKGLLGSLVASNTEGPAGVADELSAAKHLCFVITDMESSTAMAAENTHAFTRLQEIHDAVCSCSLHAQLCTWAALAVQHDSALSAACTPCSLLTDGCVRNLR